MAKKKFYINATIVVADPTKSREAVIDGLGNTITPKSIGKKYIAAGEPVELEEAEGNALVEKYGAYDPTPRDLNKVKQTIATDEPARLEKPIK